MGLSGLALIGFIVAHLAGNLFLLEPSGSMFNQYAKKLHDLGPFKFIAQVGLFTLFVVHIFVAIGLKLNHKAARPQGYALHKSKKGPSMWSPASLYMAITGGTLLVFLIIHIKQFTLGPGIEDGYVTEVYGTEARDLHKLVVETFSNPMWVAFYVAVMTMLGFHMRHGFWSSFQSLGALNSRLEKPMQLLGLAVAALLALGFIIIPIYVYIALGGAQ
jgi:succinate dehydrogenase / fumarate reductase cytochrome b subunit